MSEGERGRRGGQGEEGASCAGPCGRTWSFTPGRWEPWRAVGEGGAGPDLGAHRRPLVASLGRTECGDEGGAGDLRGRRNE